jgi:hypothetical protein
MKDFENRFMNRKTMLVSMGLLEFSDWRVRKLMCASRKHLKRQKDAKKQRFLQGFEARRICSE